jgi:hypothetical protein
MVVAHVTMLRSSSSSSVQRSAVTRICYVSRTDDQWLQAGLPVRHGGLGSKYANARIFSILASETGTQNLQTLSTTESARPRGR